MSRIFRPIFLIAGNTITGVLRGVVLNILLVMAGLLIIIAMSTSALEPAQVRRMLIDAGLAGITIMGAVIAVLTGFTLIPKEVESRTLYPVLSKPVQRWQFVLGKFVGASGINAITIGLLSILFFAVYYIKQQSFDTRLAMAVVMIFAMTVVLSAIVVFLSTFMSWIGTIIVSMVVWFIGSYSQFLWDFSSHESHGGEGGFSTLMYKLVQHLLPNFQAMDLRYAIVAQDVPTFEAMQILAPLGFAALYMVIVLVVAMVVFSYREL